MTGLMMLCAAYPASAAVDVLVSEPFDGTSLDAAWEKGIGTSGFTVSGGDLTMTNAAATGGQRSMISRNTDGSGNAQYNGVPAFNFFDHELTVDVDLKTVGGAPWLSCFFGVCYSSLAANRSPYDAEDGVFIAFDRHSTGDRIVTFQKFNGGTTAVAHIGYVSGIPTNLVVTLDGSSWTLDMGGATFTQGGFTGTSSASGTFSVDESAFNDFYFTAGMRQITAGTAPGEMTVGGIEISAETADSPLPEGVLVRDPFSGATLSGEWKTGNSGAGFAVSDGNLTMSTGGTNGALRAIIGRNTDDEGNTLYNEAVEVFYYYDHRLITDVDVSSVSGSVSGASRISWFIGVCDAATVNDYSPYESEDGVYLAVDLNSTGYRIVSYEVNGGVENITHIGYLDAFPSRLTLTMAYNEWMLEMSGATFTQGEFAASSSATGLFSTIGESSFSEFNFTIGIRQIGSVTVPGAMQLSNVEIAMDYCGIAPPAPTLTSEPAANGLRLNWAGVARGTYAVQSRTNLAEGGWRDRVEDISGIDGVLSATNNLSAPTEYFRVIAY